MAESRSEQGLAGNIIELSKHSLVYGVGVLSRLSSFILLPIHTAYLSQHDYGIVALLLAFMGIMAVFCSYGMNVAFLRWYVPEEDSEEKKRIFSTVYYGIAFVSIVISLLVFLLSRGISGVILGDRAYFSLVYVASAIILFDALFHFPQILMQAQKKSFGYVGVVFLNVSVNLVLTYYLIVVKGYRIEGVLYATLAASVSAFVLTFPLVLKNLKLYFSFKDYSEYVRFGLPYVANTVFVVLLDLSDRFLLKMFLDPESVALYSANYKLGAAMAIIVNAYRLAWHPFFLSLTNSTDAKRTFSKVYTYFLMGTCGVYLLVSIFVNDIVRIRFFGMHLIAEQYWSGTFIIPWILVSYIVMGSYVTFAAGIHIEKKTKFTPLFTGVGLAVNLGSNLVLIPWIGIYGAALATLLGYAAMTAVQYLTVQKYYPVKYEGVRILKILSITALVFAVYKVFLFDAGVAAKLLLVASYPLLLFGVKFFQPAEYREMKRLALKLANRG